ARSEPGLLGRPIPTERTATAPHNFVVAETFKTALAAGLVHIPYHELAEGELRALEMIGGRVDHPRSGPITTSDIADCLMEVTDQLIGDDAGALVHEDLAAVRLGGRR